MQSIGKQLREAREHRRLSLEEAAHATKLRPDKILALESDDYERFGGNAYARGFLLIYGRFLNVPVDAFANNLKSANPINVADYQYLSNAPTPVPEPAHIRRAHRRRRPSILPLVGFFVALVGAGFAYSVYISWQRISGDKPASTTILADPVANPLPAQVSNPPPEAATPAISENGNVVASANPAPEPVAPDGAPVLPAVAMEPAPVAPVPSAPNEVLVQPLQKTWVIVRKNEPDSAPIFEDYLYPNDPPLKLKGARFYIEARDPAAVQISKNGAPIAYQAPGVVVQ